MLKRAIAIAAAAVAGIAAAVFLLIPVGTFYEVLICLTAGGVAAGCVALWNELGDAGSQPYSLWPPARKKK